MSPSFNEFNENAFTSVQYYINSINNLVYNQQYVCGECRLIFICSIFLRQRLMVIFAQASTISRSESLVWEVCIEQRKAHRKELERTQMIEKDWQEKI